MTKPLDADEAHERPDDHAAEVQALVRRLGDFGRELRAEGWDATLQVDIVGVTRFGSDQGVVSLRIASPRYGVPIESVKT